LKKLAFLGGAAGLGLLALLSSPVSQAADHLDSTALTNKMADINDVYGWMTSDGAKINLAMTVAPNAGMDDNFGTSVQYVFHLTRYEFNGAADFPIMQAQIAAGVETRVICTFASNTDGKCWVVDSANKVLDYVAGDFSMAGQTSESGKLRVFAGRRSDPFFFNLSGFKRALAAFIPNCTGGDCPAGLNLNAAGCPDTDAATAGALRGLVGATPTTAAQAMGCPQNEPDCFKNANVMAIVVQIDKTLVVDDTKKLLSVWGSTHAGQ
jgi:hypothetical protein